MKYLKIFEDFGDIDSICREFGITNYTINSDGSIDVQGDVHLDDKDLIKLPLKFRKVSGDFYCRDNQLTSLEGSPQTVGSFDCNYNQLTSLGGSPKTVNRDFYCSYNQLASLEGSPQTIGRNFYCDNNKLTSLEGSPQTIGRNFYCNNNKLTSLEGSPKTVDSGFYCNNNQLTSLEGSPQTVGGFYCHNNPVEIIWNLFEDYSKVDLFNDYDPVRNDRIIILDRLNAFFEEIGKPEVTEVRGYKCI